MYKVNRDVLVLCDSLSPHQGYVSWECVEVAVHKTHLFSFPVVTAYVVNK